MSTASMESVAAVAPTARPLGARRWLAIGSGVGLEVAGPDLQATVVRVRPGGVAVLGTAAFARFRERPAAEWGAELLGFLRRAGAAHMPVTLLLPRELVTVRQVMLPGVADKDLPSAIGFQVDALHSYPEDDITYAFARVAAKSPAVLVGITRRSTVEEWAGLFSEAGLKVSSFTFSAAALHKALRLVTQPLEAFVAVGRESGELYGESPARPVFTAVFPVGFPQAVARAAAELRLPPEAEPLALEQVLPQPVARPVEGEEAVAVSPLSYAAALSAACPWLGLSVNLLPAELRRAPSRWIYAPTAVLAVALAMLLVALALQSRYEERRYLQVIQGEIVKVEPKARQVAAVEQAIEKTRTRTALLDAVRRRSRNDMDALGELTRIVPPPGWITSLELTRAQVTMAGEADQSASLLKLLDTSPLFQGSEFTVPLQRLQNGAESFRVKANREKGSE